MNFIRANLLSLILLLLMCVINFTYYSGLPDQIPSKYTMDGEITSTLSKQLMVAIVPASYLVLILLTNLIIAVSPQKFSMPRSKQSMHRILFAVGILMVSVHCVLLFANGDMEFFTEFFTYGMALFLIVAGNVTGKMERWKETFSWVYAPPGP